MSETVYVTMLVHEVPCDANPDVIYLNDIDHGETLTSSDDKFVVTKLKRVYDTLTTSGLFSPIDYDGCGYVNGVFTIHDTILACRELGEDAYGVQVIEMRRISDPDLSHVFADREAAITYCESLTRHGRPAYAQAVTVL